MRTPSKATLKTKYMLPYSPQRRDPEYKTPPRHMPQPDQPCISQALAIPSAEKHNYPYQSMLPVNLLCIPYYSSNWCSTNGSHPFSATAPNNLIPRHIFAVHPAQAQLYPSSAIAPTVRSPGDGGAESFPIGPNLVASSQNQVGCHSSLYQAGVLLHTPFLQDSSPESRSYSNTSMYSGRFHYHPGMRESNLMSLSSNSGREGGVGNILHIQPEASADTTINVGSTMAVSNEQSVINHGHENHLLSPILQDMKVDAVLRNQRLGMAKTQFAVGTPREFIAQLPESTSTTFEGPPSIEKYINYSEAVMIPSHSHYLPTTMLPRLSEGPSVQTFYNWPRALPSNLKPPIGASVDPFNTSLRHSP